MEKYNNAILITNEEYNKLDNPIFEGQTKVNSLNQYKMYWSVNDVMYYTINTS